MGKDLFVCFLKFSEVLELHFNWDGFPFHFYSNVLLRVVISSVLGFLHVFDIWVVSGVWPEVFLWWIFFGAWLLVSGFSLLKSMCSSNVEAEVSLEYMWGEIPCHWDELGMLLGSRMSYLWTWSDPHTFQPHIEEVVDQVQHYCYPQITAIRQTSNIYFGTLIVTYIEMVGSAIKNWVRSEGI